MVRLPESSCGAAYDKPSFRKAFAKADADLAKSWLAETTAQLKWLGELQLIVDSSENGKRTFAKVNLSGYHVRGRGCKRSESTLLHSLAQ